MTPANSCFGCIPLEIAYIIIVTQTVIQALFLVAGFANEDFPAFNIVLGALLMVASVQGIKGLKERNGHKCMHFVRFRAVLSWFFFFLNVQAEHIEVAVVVLLLDLYFAYVAWSFAVRLLQTHGVVPVMVTYPAAGPAVVVHGHNEQPPSQTPLAPFAPPDAATGVPRASFRAAEESKNASAPPIATFSDLPPEFIAKAHKANDGSSSKPAIPWSGVEGSSSRGDDNV